MLAVVMDGGSHMKRPWDDEQMHRSPENRHFMQMIPESGGARSSVPQLHTMPSPSNMLPPIVTAPEQPARPMRNERLSASSRPPQRPSHAESPLDASSKRPRLYYDVSQPSDTGRSQSSTHAAPVQTPPTGHDRHDQLQWSMWESPNREGMHVPRNTCQTCIESKSLVEKVISGLERLEAEMRQVLACSPMGRTAKEVCRSSSEPST